MCPQIIRPIHPKPKWKRNSTHTHTHTHYCKREWRMDDSTVAEFPSAKRKSLDIRTTPHKKLKQKLMQWSHTKYRWVYIFVGRVFAKDEKKIVCSVYRAARTRKTTTTNSNLLSQTTNSLTFFFSFACLFVSHAHPSHSFRSSVICVRWFVYFQSSAHPSRSLLANWVCVCVSACKNVFHSLLTRTIWVCKN